MCYCNVTSKKQKKNVDKFRSYITKAPRKQYLPLASSLPCALSSVLLKPRLSSPKTLCGAGKQPVILLNSSRPEDSSRSSAFESDGHLALQVGKRNPPCVSTCPQAVNTTIYLVVTDERKQLDINFYFYFRYFLVSKQQLNLQIVNKTLDLLHFAPWMRRHQGLKVYTCSVRLTVAAQSGSN